MSYHDQIKRDLTNLIDSFNQASKNFDEKFEELQRRNDIVTKNEQIVKQLAKERQIGFPTLAKAYDDFFKLQDKNLINFLAQKNVPAIASSKVVAEYAKLRRRTAEENKVLRYIIEYYESIAPFLTELKEEVQDITEEDRELMSEYTEQELEDKVTNFLTKEEYRQLTTAERNQLALDRFWKRPKSKSLIGKLYERYIGYIYENEGYDVEYVGIFKGFEDLGRDIIASKDNKLIVIQCKNWSKFRTIYEKHIFQFFGTVFQYKDENKDKEVFAVFYTSTKLSDLARRFATELGIELKENHKLTCEYPCIKCNVNKIENTKIYHLPFDQQYDHVKIEPKKGEFYCQTVQEAEAKGFRRAYRWKSPSDYSIRP